MELDQKKVVRKQQKLLKEIIKYRETAKELYEKADISLEKLLAISQVGDKIKSPTGEDYELVDNFATTNKVFRAHGISRYELKAVKGSKPVTIDVGKS